MTRASSGRLAGLLLLSFAVSLSCAKGGPTGHSKVAGPDEETTIVGPDGVLVVVPKGALDAEARITVQALPPTRRPGNAVAVADGVRLLPEGQEFKTGVQVTIPITPSMLPAGKTVDDVVVMRAEQNGDVFVPLPTRRNGNAVVAQTEHFSDFVAVVALDGQSLPCVDTYCSGNETCETCPIDCGLCTAPGTCGNGLCEANESCGTCLYDCHCLTPDGGVVPPATVVVGSKQWLVGVDPGPYTQAQAIAACEALTLEGFTDWRLPSRDDLLAVLDYTITTGPRIVPLLPTDSSIRMWLSDPVAANPTLEAWSGDANGSFFHEGVSLAHPIRCVRDLGPTQLTRIFTSNGDGTSTDSRSGLVWNLDDIATTGTLSDASTTCLARTLGARLWRVPTMNELSTLIDVTDGTPPVVAGFSMPMSGAHWSSSPSDAGGTVWVLSFTDGLPSTASTTGTNGTLCVSGP